MRVIHAGSKKMEEVPPAAYTVIVLLVASAVTLYLL